MDRKKILASHVFIAVFTILFYGIYNFMVEDLEMWCLTDPGFVVVVVVVLT